MELYIIFFMIITVALIVLAIYTTKVEHLAVTNRTRIARLETTEIARKCKDAETKRGTRKISDLPVVYPVLGTIEYELQKAIEENKSLSFQLAEVSKALQEKKLLIYEMDEKLSKLDAKKLKGERVIEIKSKEISALQYEKSNLLESLTIAAKELSRSGRGKITYMGVDLASGLDMAAVFKCDPLGTWSVKPYLGSSPLTTGGEQFKDMFMQESEELKGFGVPVVKWNTPDSNGDVYAKGCFDKNPEVKPLIDAEFVTQDYGESERIEFVDPIPKTPAELQNELEELQDLSGSDPIFEADAAEADTAAKLNFQPLNVAGHWLYEVNEVDPEKLKEVISSRRGTWGSKDGGMQNIPRTEEANSFIWWAQQTTEVKRSYKLLIGASEYAILSDEEILRVYRISKSAGDINLIDLEALNDPTKCPDCQRGEKFYDNYGQGEEEVDCFTCNGTGLPKPPESKRNPKRNPKKTLRETISVKWWNALSEPERDALMDKYPEHYIGNRKGLRCIYLLETDPYKR